LPRQKLTYPNLQPRQYDPTGTYGGRTINIMIHIYQDILKSPVWYESQMSARYLNALGSLEPQDINNHFRHSPSFLSLWETKLVNLVVVTGIESSSYS
jgi:hypothetical protein